MKVSDEKKNRAFVLISAVLIGVLFLINLAERTNSYNSTLLAFSYKYGFIPRGFLGTVYQGLNRVLPFEMQSYVAVNTFTLVATILLCILVWLFVRFMIKRVSDANADSVQLLATLFIIFTIPTFSYYYNFGRLDIYLVMLTMLSVELIVKDKALWLLVPIAAVGMMIHEGYVFMYLNVIVALLLYRGVKDGKKYFILLGVVVVVSGMLFCYFTFVGRGLHPEHYDDIISVANSMCYKNKCHKDVVRAEVLGVNLWQEEAKYRVNNHKELPVFILLFSPFIILGFKMVRKLLGDVLGKADSLVSKLSSLCIAFGGFATLPLFVLKVDYGRWVYAFIAYYLIVCMALNAMNSNVSCKATAEDVVIYDRARFRGIIIAQLLCFYALLFVPFYDLDINLLMKLFFNH